MMMPSKPVFATVDWKRDRATFQAARDFPVDAPAPAALVFPFYGDKIVLADIVSRGWCIPSGHVEPGETLEQAVRREAFEEAGVTLARVAPIGYFVLTDRATGTVRYAPTFIGEVGGLREVTPGEESRGRQLVNCEDVADLYFAWDDLLAQVFVYAQAEKEVQFKVGTPLRALTG